MPAIRILTSAAAIAVTLIAAPAMAAGGHPTGKYCGELWSGGVMGEVQTSFLENTKSGKVTGSYVFDDKGQAVDGLLADMGDDGDGNELTRLFVWRDKYGYGKLVVTFSPDFASFEGKWSDGGPANAPWTGKRCSTVTS